MRDSGVDVLVHSGALSLQHESASIDNIRAHIELLKAKEALVRCEGSSFCANIQCQHFWPHEYLHDECTKPCLTLSKSIGPCCIDRNGDHEEVRA